MTRQRPGQQTLTALYREVTGDTSAHQRAIDGRFRKLDVRRQRLIRVRLTGESYHGIAARAGITAASVRSAILRALEQIRKGIAGEPRFNRIGHTGRPKKKVK